MHPHIIPAFGMPAGMEWLVILILGLLFFGNRLPSMMRGLGGSIKEFKKGMEDGDDKTKVESKSDAPDGAVSRDSVPRDGARPGEDLKPDANKH
jgi:sec-independent protein translocase protein TatA